VPNLYARLRRMKARLRFSMMAVSAGALLTTACSTLPIVIPASENSFHGIYGLLGQSSLRERPPQASAKVRIMIIHGMGTSAPDAFDPFILALAGRLRLVQIVNSPPEPLDPSGCGTTTSATPSGLVHPAPVYIPIDNVPHEAQARLYTFDFAPSSGTESVLSISYLYWAPLTGAIKCKLEVEDSEAPQKQWFADVARQFIDDKLGDVALYAGHYRDHIMRPSVQKALCMLVDGQPSPNGSKCHNGDAADPTVLISHSLGGYMLMDALHEELRRNRNDGSLNANSAAYKIMANTELIYMMANQLALLDLTQLDHYPFPANPVQFREAASVAASTKGGSGQLMKRFSEDWSQVKHRARPNTPVQSQIVAFSDPNDILSWLAKSDDPKIQLTNVYLPNNEFAIPGLFSDPVNAHTGYFTNNAVLDLLVCGMNNGAVSPCPDFVP